MSKKTSDGILDQQTGLTDLQHHLEYVIERAEQLHTKTERWEDLNNQYGTDATKLYTLMTLSEIRVLAAAALAHVDYLHQLHAAFREPQ